MIPLQAITLEENYETKGRDIYASDISKEITNNFLLFSYDDDKHMLRTNAQKVISLFKAHGVLIAQNDVKYITFREKSQINIDKIADTLRDEFVSKYPSIKIKSLKIYPRSYLTALPKTYSLSLQKQTLYKNYSTIAVITPEHKMIFFDYILDAEIDVVVSIKSIPRHQKLSFENTKMKSVKFLSFKASPLTEIVNHQYQSKFSIKSDEILTRNDIEQLSVVRRNDQVIAFVEDGGVSITFNVTAQQDGKEGDIIVVRKSDGKTLRAKVIGEKRVQIQ
jgi:flagella basal body P-ring formation protein FlgA